MQLKTILRILGVLLMVFSLSNLTPIGINFIYHDGYIHPFLISFAMTFTSGALLWLFFRHCKQDLKSRDGFMVVVLFWFVLSLFAAIPFVLATLPHQTFTDAMFESVAGFTTTGSTVVKHIDALPHAMRFYRQQLQFLGGMGIIVLAVAILPMLGVGGMQLFRAETPGPLKENKLTPRITETAKALWFIYVFLTIACAIAYWLAGMSVFNAVGESFTTISTGGFTLHDSSFAFYHSTAIQLIAVFFMILGGTNFSLHYLVLRNRSLKHYWQDEELRSYLYILATIVIIATVVLIFTNTFPSNEQAFVESLFNVVSMVTTTGFISSPFYHWPLFLPMLIMLVAILGGCAASTSGGIKIIRGLLLKKQVSRELQRLIHPQAVINIKFGRRVIPNQVLQAMWGFVAAFIGLYLFLLLLLMSAGLDLYSAFGVLSASMANAGIGIGPYATSAANLNTMSKWILMFAMLAGRLEIFTLLVLFTPSYWKK